MNIEDKNFWDAVERWRQDNMDYIPRDLMRRSLERARRERSREVRSVFGRLFRHVFRALILRRPRIAPAPAPAAVADAPPADWLTDGQVTHLRQSWALVTPIADQAIETFYRRLFEIDPPIRQVFRHTDMAQLRQRLIAALQTVMDAADQPAALLPVLRNLGAAHVGYGARPEHYQSVGAALLWTLESGLGAAWTEEVADAWQDLIGRVATAMLAGAAEVEPDHGATPDLPLAA